METAPEPLRWPAHFPPTDPWKKFFLGVRALGPDLSFFRALRESQAGRSREVMQLWPDWPSRRMAFLLGTVLRIGVRWPKPYFIPADQFGVVAYGPSFQDIDDSGFVAATYMLEKHLGIKLTNEFWEEAIVRSFGEVVDQLVTAVQNRVPSNSG